MHSIKNYARLVAITTLLAACTDKGETTTGSSSSGGEATTAGDTTAGPTPTTGDSTGEQPQGMFGFVCVDLVRGEGFEGDPFVGTRKVVVTLAYDTCLADYYVTRHPEMRLDGEDGAQVFAAWKTRLCTEDVAGLVGCSVDGIIQVLDALENVYEASVTYAITDAAALEGGTLLWGPGPLAGFAECSDGFEPTVSLKSLTGVIGLDDNDAAIWQTQSWSGTPARMQATGQACIQANIAPTPP